ncbi:MAG: hypothetical protein OHK0017_13500 [Patescibacteria group bacterium]
MLIIKNQSLNEIFQELSELSLERKELGILVENLPPEIDGDVSLSHLIYTLRNYPRKIVWFTDNQQVFELFYRNKIPIYKFHSKVNKVDAITLELNRQAHEIGGSSTTLIDLDNTVNNVNAIESLTTQSTEKEVRPVISENVYEKPLIEDYREHLSQNPSFDTQADTTDSINISESEPVLNIKSSVEPQEPLVASSINDLPVFSFKKDATPIQPLNQNKILLSKPESNEFTLDDDTPRVQMVQIDEEVQSNSESRDLSQELDFKRLRNKILASKEVLESINRATNYNNPNRYFQLVDNQIEHIEKLQQQQSQNSTSDEKRNDTFRSNNSFRWFNAFAYSFLVLVISAGIAIGFPTVAYTIEVQPERKEGQGTFNFERAGLRKQNFKFTLNAKGDATGTVTLESTRAKGEVRLLNKSGNEINLDSDSFYFEVGGKRYNPVFDSTQIRNVSIPAKNHISGPVVSLKIESSLAGTGTEFDLAEGTELIPRNLKGVPIGPNFTAVVSQEVKGNVQTGSKTVTDSDIRAVRSQIETSLSQEKELKVKEIESTKEYVSNASWSVNVESEFNTDHKVGDVADNVSITAKISADIYYISLKDLSDQILNSETKADQVVKTIINNSDKAWSPEAQKLSLETKYVVKLKTEISPQKIREIAEDNGLNTNQTTSEIKKTYEDVAIVKPQVTGIPVPGITPRIQIEVIQRNLNE